MAIPQLLPRLRPQRFNLKTIRLLSQVNRANPHPIQPRPRTLNSDPLQETPTSERIGKKIDLMATRSYTSRRELESRFHPAVTVLVPLTAILLQAFLPRPFPRLAILDLPLIITVFSRFASQPGCWNPHWRLHRLATGRSHCPADRSKRNGEIGYWLYCCQHWDSDRR